MAGPVIKLRCTSWGQLATIYERDLRRSMLFVRTTASLPLGREVRVDIIMPSGSVVNLEGRVSRLVPASEPGPGIELVLTKLPASAMWMIESALGRTTHAVDDAAAADTHLADEGSADAEEQLVAALEGELRAFRTMQPHQILGIAHDAGEAAARKAFGELSKRYHPDRFARFESDLARRVASDVFVVLRDAYRRMADTGGRPPLSGPAPTRMPPPPPRRPPRAPEDSGRGPPRITLPPPPVPTDQQRVISPAVPASTLVTFSGSRPPAAPPPQLPTPVVAPFDYGDAPRLSMDYLFGDLGPASEPPEGPLALDEPELVAADQLVADGHLDGALAAYDELLRQNPTHRGARAGREIIHGLRKLAAGDREVAAQRFEQALEIEPWSDRAARELAALRRSATDRGKGLLAKLLGKGGGS